MKNIFKKSSFQSTENTVYCSSYSKIINDCLSIKFNAKCECGMGGPIYGTLIIQNFGTFEYAFGPVAYDKKRNELGFITWKEDKGGAKNDVHIINCETKNETIYEIDFDHHFISAINDKTIELLNSYDNQKRIIDKV